MFWRENSKLKIPKRVNLASFWKTKAWCETVLPDMSILMGQKLVENANVKKFKLDILDDFQTLWALFHFPEKFWRKSISQTKKILKKSRQSVVVKSYLVS